MIRRQRQEQMNRISYLQNELCSLGIDCKRIDELDDREELQALVTAIKEVYFQHYKSAYDNNDNESQKNGPSECAGRKLYFTIYGRELIK